MHSRRRPNLMKLLLALPAMGAAAARAQTYSTTPVTVYSAATSGFGTLTAGVNSSTSVDPLINQDSGVISGYVASSSLGYRDLYYLNLATDTATIVGFDNTSHVLSLNTPTLLDVSTTGTLVGTQSRASSAGSTTPLGQDVFTSTAGAAPVALPLPTTVLGGNSNYTYTDPNTGYTVQSMNGGQGSDNASSFNTEAIGTGGIVVGTVQRYAGNTNGTPGTIEGTDGFYYNPSTTTSVAIGLTGSQYESTSPTGGVTNGTLVHNTTVTGSAGTAAAGFTELDTSTEVRYGYDSWYYTPTTGTNQIGLVGGIYQGTGNATGTTTAVTFENSQTYRTNSMGQVAGKSLVGPNSGVISGTYGNDAWLYTPPASGTPGTASGFGTTSAGTYTRLGLFATPTSSSLGNVNSASFRNTNIIFLTDQGTAAGTSNRYDNASPTNNFEGAAAWYYNGTTNIDISPASSGAHQYVQGGLTYSSNTITAINGTAGAVGGYTTRIAGTGSGAASLGQDAYVYEGGQTTFVDPTSSANTTNYELSYVGVVGSNGAAVGYYNTYSGTTSTTITGSDLFVWTLSGGLETLASYPSSASGSMAAYVDAFQFGPDGSLYGPNTYGSGATSIVEFTATPEPTSICYLVIASAGLLLQRRRTLASLS